MGESRGVALIYVPEGVDPATRFAGRSLDQRAVALARSAGLEPYLVGRPPRASSGDARAWLAPGTRLPALATSQGAVVLWRCDVAWAVGALRTLLARTEPGRGAVRDDLGRVALVHVPVAPPGGIVPANLDLAAAGATVVGDPGSMVGHRLIALDVSSVRGSGGGRAKVVRGTSPGSAVGGVPRGTPLRRAAAELIRSLPNPRDGLFDRLLNRHVSARLTPLLLRFPVTPNQVTALSLAVGVLAACGLAGPGIFWPVVGALLLQLTAVLDCIDGEIARVKVLETEWGDWFDITSDSIIHVVVFLGMAVHAWPELGTGAAWTLGALFASGGFASFAVVTRAERSEDRWKAIDAWQARLLGRLLATLTTRDLSVLVFAAAATGLLEELLIGAAFAAHVFWVGVLALHAGLMRRSTAAGAAAAADAARTAAAAAPAAVHVGAQRERRIG